MITEDQLEGATFQDKGHDTVFTVIKKGDKYDYIWGNRKIDDASFDYDAKYILEWINDTNYRANVKPGPNTHYSIF